MVPLITRAFAEQDKCIFLCTDNGFAPVAAVTIQSIIETSNPNEKYDILLFHSGIMPFHKTVIENMADNYDNISIRVVDISLLTNRGSFYTENRKTITQETYYRLFVPFILEDAYTRAAYIDCDMVVVKNINQIFHHDIDQYSIGAVRDFWGICECYMPHKTLRAYRESIGLDNIDDYIIGGTILFNLEKYRKKFSFEQTLDLVHSNQWHQHDQDVINVMCKNDLLHLSAEWGMMSEWGNNHQYLPSALLEELQSAYDDYAIYHFGGSRKPWKKYYEKENEYFWTIASKTPYFPYLISLIANNEYKFYVLKKISDGKMDVFYGSDAIFFKTQGIVAGHSNSGYTQYRAVDIRDGVLYLEGAIASFALDLTAELKPKIILNGSCYDVDSSITDNYKVAKLDEAIYRLESFKTTIKLSQGEVYRLKVVGETGGLTITPSSTLFGDFCPIGKEQRNSYYYTSGWMISYKRSGEIVVREAGKVDVFKKELALYKELWKTKIKHKRTAVIARAAVLTVKPFLKKPIWLVSDRISKADDNGEVFFAYLQQHKKEIRSYFILDKTVSDYRRLRKIGKVVQPYSMKHKLLALVADCTISSQTDLVFRNPFKRNWRPYRDLLWSTKFVFLQHGIILTNLTRWLHRKNQYIAGFVTSAEKEYQSVKNGEYDYDSEVWLTGMPRYDRLESKTEKIVTIAPTWRKYLAMRQNPETGIWELIPSFSNSKYVCFYRNLLNNQLLADACKKYGYEIQFVVHPSYYGHIDRFEFGSNVNIVSDKTSYQEIFSKSALMLTDYSSLIHDFVYLRKPVIYCQFDKEEFFSDKHQCDGVAIDYEKLGYGEVEYTVEGTVNRIIEYMENGCKLKEEYRKRIDEFFAFNDRNNCQRVYEKIMELDSRK